MPTTVGDWDYLAALIHARHSRVAQGERLDVLCRLQTIPELARATAGQLECREATDLQSALVVDLVRELCEIVRYVSGVGAPLLASMLKRFQVENLKLLARGRSTGASPGMVQASLVPLPKDLEPPTLALLSAKSWEDFAGIVPGGTLRQRLTEIVAKHGGRPQPFYLEAALDQGYFEELLARVDALSGEDSELIRAIAYHEAGVFLLMLTVRGRYHYQVPPERLLPLHVSGSGISRKEFSAMLTAPDFLTAVDPVIGRVLGLARSDLRGLAGASASSAASVLEALAWGRFLSLSTRAFRRGHIGLGMVVGYVGIRRVEVANLITISEGIRAGMSSDALRTRLIPRTVSGALHV